jgi:hypothetical protein
MLLLGSRLLPPAADHAKNPNKTAVFSKERRWFSDYGSEG